MRILKYANEIEQEYSIKILEDDVINISQDFIFPNYYTHPLTQISHKYNYEQWEIPHTFNKLFCNINFKQTNLCIYETKQVQIQSNDIVFDCGANLGIFSGFAATKCKQVFSFEPSSIPRVYLKETKKYFPNIIICPYAVSNENKKDVILQNDNSAANHFKDTDIKAEQNNILYTEQVEKITLDYFCYTYNIFPTFIKADIEGSEINMILGAKKLINEKKPKLSIVMHANTINNIGFIMNDFPFYKWEIKSNNEYKILIGKSYI